MNGLTEQQTKFAVNYIASFVLMTGPSRFPSEWIVMSEVLLPTEKAWIAQMLARSVPADAVNWGIRLDDGTVLNPEEGLQKFWREAGPYANQ
jgi:hypothetical protein